MSTEAARQDHGGVPLTYAVVDLDAIRYNITAIRAHVGPGVSLFAAVKANAYGHGAVPVARAALESGASRLLVARVEEGLELRRAGITAPIHILGYNLPAEAPLIAEHDLSPSITTVEGAQALSAAAAALGRRVRAHVKVDTGMGRYGLLPDEVAPFVRRVSALPGLEVEGVFTHFAVADGAAEGKAFTEQQFSQFRRVREALTRAGLDIPLWHAANSAAALDLPQTHLDAVRIGIAMYGLYPSEHVSRRVPLKPALSLHSHVARVQTLPPGSSLGYGRTFVAARPTRVALVPIGYGDGFHRLLSNRGHVLINGQRAPIAGRVSMDQITVDATDLGAVAQDDAVVLLGEQGGERITAEEIAAHAETINYEVVTSLTARVTRVFVRGGRVVQVVRLAGD